MSSKSDKHYIIKNNDTNTYFGFTESNAHSIEMSVEDAFVFTLDKAKNVINNYASKFPNLVIIDINVSADGDIIVYNPPKSSAKKIYDYKDGDIRCDNITSIKELANTIVAASKSLDLALHNAPRTLSAIDGEVNNLLHEIELSSDMNARDGYLAYKKLRTALRKRRDIKNSISILEAAKASNISKAAIVIDKATKDLSKKKVYHTRDVDTSLFTDYE